MGSQVHGPLKSTEVVRLHGEHQTRLGPEQAPVLASLSPAASACRLHASPVSGEPVGVLPCTWPQSLAARALKTEIMQGLRSRGGEAQRVDG